MNNARPSHRSPHPSHSADALLSGLNRMKIPQPPPNHLQLKQPQPAPSSSQRSRNPRLSSSPKMRAPPSPNVPYAYFPRRPSPRYPDRSLSVPRADWLEVIEHATGLGRSDDGDVAAADKLLHWIRIGSLDPADVFRAIVTGSAHADVALNARVLSVVSWLCVVGGPDVLPAAVYVTSARKPSPGLRICYDVLKSLGYTNAPEDVLCDDNKVREMRIQAPGEPSDDHSSTLKAGRRLSVSDAMLAAAVEAYAISLGRKLIFHHRYPEVEANYSLDRYFRKMRIENNVDYEREAFNLERHAQLLSKVTAAEMALIVHSSVVAADRLERAGAPADLCILALAEACNAFSFAEYLLMKVTAPRVGDFDMENARAVLIEMLDQIHSRRGPELRILKRFVDPRVMATIMDRKVRPSRPESKHRREIMCTFSSFEAMHRAFTPNLGRHSTQQK